MLTLSYGYKLPQSPDKGPIVFPALEANINRLNGHNHDGTNSAPIPGSSIVGASVAILAAGWVALGGGHFRQQVTLPPGYDYDKQAISFRISPSGHYVYPTVEKVSATQFWVYTIDNSLDYTAVVGG